MAKIKIKWTYYWHKWIPWPLKPMKTCITLHVLWKRYKLRICRTSFGGRLGISQIKKFAQGWQSGNQARIVLEWPLNKNHQKKFIGKNISRSAIGFIGPSNRLYSHFLWLFFPLITHWQIYYLPYGIINGNIGINGGMAEGDNGVAREAVGCVNVAETVAVGAEYWLCCWALLADVEELGAAEAEIEIIQSGKSVEFKLQNNSQIFMSFLFIYFLSLVL